MRAFFIKGDMLKIAKRSIKKHLFICTNMKLGGDSCAQKESEDIVNKLKGKLREENLWDEIKVTKSGCLGPCSEGISATLYPDNLLITQINKNDIEALYSLLTNS